jgi:putative ATPase
MMREQGYGAGYAYDHDAEGGHAGLSYFPEGMDRQSFYEPTDRGAEEGMAERLDALEEKRRERG